VADAASLGLHGLYSPERIALIERTGDILFRQPDRCHYDGQPGYFAHEGRRAGMPSQYGEHLALVAALLRRDGGQSPAAHQRDFLARFGPGGSWVGYADRPTRALVARLLSEAGEVPAVTGIDDDQMPVLSVVAPLHDAGASRGQVSDSVRVLSTNAEAKAGALALFDLLAALAVRDRLAGCFISSGVSGRDRGIGRVRTRRSAVAGGDPAAPVTRRAGRAIRSGMPHPPGVAHRVSPGRAHG